MGTSNERATVERQGRTFTHELGAGAEILRGTMVMLVAGKAQAGAAAVGASCVGIAKATVAIDEGDLSVDADLGCFSMANSPTDPLAGADVGSDCFIEDNDTIAKTDGAGTLSKAGRVREIDGNAVWVEFT